MDKVRSIANELLEVMIRHDLTVDWAHVVLDTTKKLIGSETKLANKEVKT